MSTKCRSYADLFAAHSEVTGSNFLIVPKLPSGEESKIVIDCGIFQESQYEKYNDSLIFDANTISASFVTHAHADHVGRLPLMIKNGYKNSIFCTEDTKKILSVALEDNFFIQQKQSKRNNRQNLYSLIDTHNAYAALVGSEYNKWYTVGNNIKYMFLSNGHLQGAAMIVIGFHDYNDDYMYFLFTGDYCPRNTFFRVLDIPQEILDLPLNIIIESTYGHVNSTEDGDSVFEKNVIEALSRGCICVILTYSLGRAQEMLYFFKLMQEQGLLELNIPIFADGMLAYKYTHMFMNGQLKILDHMKKFVPQNCHFVTTPEMRESLMTSPKQKIILTTSGMGSYGPAQIYLPHYIWNSKTLIHFTGYCAEGTYGRKLKEAQDGKVFFTSDGGLLELKKARVEYTSEFSKHARADELIGLLKRFNHIDSVIVNHGNTETKKIFAERVYKELGIRKTGVINRGTGFRINEYGIEKEISTLY